MREKYTLEITESEIEYEENKMLGFHKRSTTRNSFRVHRNGIVGISCQEGQISDEAGYAKAEENLERARPYPFELETGKRSRDKTQRQITDKELMVTAKECMQYIVEKYPQFIFAGSFSQFIRMDHWVNDKGLDYRNRDCAVSANVRFKHVKSKDIVDGSFGLSMRDFDKNKFFAMADNYLANYEKEVELPEDIIIDTQYHGLTGMLAWCLNGENMALGTSLLSGKIGEKVFSEEFTLLHDVSDEECWFNCFWDGEGCVTEHDKRIFIDKGVIVSGYTDKRTAQKYGIPHTGNACAFFTDIPEPGDLNLRIARSKKTVKELLDGRYCVIPVMCGGGGFSDNGDFSMPILCAMLSDGEKILGKLPPFTMVSNLYDMFGKDFIGVGADNPIYYDKQMLFRVRKGNL